MKTQLQQLKKGTNTISEYLQSFKSISDKLAAAGSVISDTDLLVYILNGLPPEYDPFVTSVRIRSPPVTTDELHSLLLTEEMYVQVRHQSLHSTSETAFFTNRGGRHAYRGNYSTTKGTNRGGRFSSRGRTNTQSFTQGNFHKQSSMTSGDSRPSCQICQKRGHTAVDCFDRMNYAFSGRIPPQQLQAMLADRYSTSNTNSSSTQSSWVADTGATSHITNELQNLNITTDYNGSDKVFVGDGTGLPIKHIGSSVLSPTSLPSHEL